MQLPEIFLILLLLIYIVSLPQLFERAGQSKVAGYIPIYNFLVWLKVIKRPWWWLILLFVPGVNFIMLTIMNVEMGIVFNKQSTGQQWFAGLLPWVFIPKLAFQEKDAEYAGPRDWSKVKKTVFREWGEAIVFAIVAASVIRTFFFEAFTIPTPSMEGSMLVGDYLFVSKMSYGPKVPQTPMSVPFMHNTIPGSMTDSYVEWFSLPYSRIPGWGSVDRYDPVVFNFPHGDTVVVDPFWVGHDYYGILRNEALSIAGDPASFRNNQEKYLAEARENLFEKKICYSCQRDQRQRSRNVPLSTGGVKARPIDKCENYVKRCVGLPGDDLQIINQVLHINGEAKENPENTQFTYHIKFNSATGLKQLAKKAEFVFSEISPGSAPNSAVVPLTAKDYAMVQNLSFVESVEPQTYPPVEYNFQGYFPNTDHPEFNSWTQDNYGPVHIPHEGETVSLDDTSIHLYKRAISVYEGNDLEIKEDGIYINGQKSDSYTFKYNYYWMMGDNRHNSADSRVWGFVPETHVVGKPVIVWFSRESKENHGDSKIRWDRIFKTKF